MRFGMSNEGEGFHLVEEGYVFETKIEAEIYARKLFPDMSEDSTARPYLFQRLFMNLRRCVMTNEELMTLIEEIARVALEDQVCSRYIEHELGATTWDLDKAYAYLEAKLNKENKDETN
jgi:hypothetical protein